LLGQNPAPTCQDSKALFAAGISSLVIGLLSIILAVFFAVFVVSSNIYYQKHISDDKTTKTSKLLFGSNIKKYNDNKLKTKYVS
jgi:hypothetical protein